MSNKLSALIGSLTIEQAKQYNAETDKILWIIDNLLDPRDIPCGWSDKNVLLVENKLCELLDNSSPEC